MKIETKPLLIELGTEELPPKSLKSLGEAFNDHILSGLSNAGLISENPSSHLFATPRRLAILVDEVAIRQADSMVERRGPAVSAAFDEAGNPSQAAVGFARSCKVEVSALERMQSDKGEWLVFRREQAGLPASQMVPDIINTALHKLPVQKRMRWGDKEAEFVRPVHWLLILHDSKIIETTLLTVTSSNKTSGHRFHHPDILTVATATDYEDTLEQSGYVMPDFDRRRDAIIEQVKKLAADKGGNALIDPALLDEVTALVEWPNAMPGQFDKQYLQVPQEALISAMQDHQKYFPVVDETGRMTSSFIFVSNIESINPSSVCRGNERVLNARFSDARFFWDTDRDQSLDSQVDRLKSVVFHNKLGSVYDRTLRVQKLTGQIADLLGTDSSLAARAALLAKADLLTGMVP